MLIHSQIKFIRFLFLSNSSRELQMMPSRCFHNSYLSVPGLMLHIRQFLHPIFFSWDAFFIPESSWENIFEANIDYPKIPWDDTDLYSISLSKYSGIHT